MSRHQPWRISSPTRRAVPMLEYLEGRSLLAVTMGALPAAIPSPSPDSAQAEAIIATMTAGAVQSAPAGQPVTFSDGIALLGADPFSQGMGVVDLQTTAPGSPATAAVRRDPAGPPAGTTPGWAAISEELARALADIEIIGGSSAGTLASAAGPKLTATTDDDGRVAIPDDRDNPTADGASDPSQTETDSKTPRPDDGHDETPAGHDDTDAPVKGQKSIEAVTSEEMNRPLPANQAVRRGAAEQWDRFVHRPRTGVVPRSAWSWVRGRAIRVPSRPAGHRPVTAKPAQGNGDAATVKAPGS